MRQLSQPARDVPEASPEGPLKVATSGTSRRPSADSQRTNKKNDNLMKKVLFRCKGYCFTHLLLFFTGKANMQSSKWGRPQESTGPSCGTSQGPDNGTFQRRPQDVSYTCFLNSTQKHILVTLTGYSRFYSEFQQREI